MASDHQLRSVGQMFAAALAIEDPDDSTRFDLISEIRRLDNAEAFTELADRAASDDAATADLAIEVLGQFGYERGRPWLEESLPLVIAATETSEPRTLATAITALGSLGDPRGLPIVLRHSCDEEPEVRFAVACALPWVAGDPPDLSAVAALIDLMTDSDGEVRDWATFGLGVQTDADSPEVRRALAERLDDPDGATGGEALVGLARRGDSSIVHRLLELLSTPEAGNLEVEAAAELGDARFLGALLELERSGWAERDPRGSILQDAIESCTA
jgi:HEAT repeat protein